MLLPIKTDVPVRRTPVVNYALIIVNVAIFIGINKLMARSMAGLTISENLMLWAESPRWYQFFTSMFMHGSWWHLLGNMVFLWVFGNALNAKLGNVVYLLFYIACGLAAGAGYVLFMNNPVVGASGAIFGVAAGFAVLYPLSRVTTVYFFFFIGVLEFSGLIVVGFFIAMNLFYLMAGVESGTAYLAHLFGALFGLISALALLATGATGRDQFDMLALVRRWRQRASSRLYMSDPGNRARATYGRVAAPVDTHGRPAAHAVPQDPQAEQIARLRAAIASAVAAADAPRAAQLYGELMRTDPEQVLPARQQLDLGSYMMSDGRYDLAALAYESLLAHYPTFESIEQVQLLLGVIYGRYLGNFARAKECLEAGLPRLRDPSQQQFARAELAHVESQT